MNPTAIAYAAQLLASLPDLIRAGVDVVNMVSGAALKMQEFVEEKRDPTPAEWGKLNADIKALRAELHKGE